MMPLQRVWDAENQMRNKLSNGPRRVQSNVKFIFTEYSATCRHTSVAEGMFVSCYEHGDSVNSRWHRGLCRTCYTCTLFVLDRNYHSVKDVFLWYKNAIQELKKF